MYIVYGQTDNAFMYSVDYLEAALRNLKYNTPGLVTSLDVVKQHFGGNVSPKSKTKPSGVMNEQTSSNSVPYLRRKGMQRFRTRIVSEFVVRL